MVSSRGHGVACLNQLFYQEGKFALGNILCGVTPKDENVLSARFLHYYLNHKKDTLIVPLMKGGANVALTVDSLRKVKVPVPPIEVQNEVVYLLSKFEDLIQELTTELTARKIQYRYYRNRLLGLENKANCKVKLQDVVLRSSSGGTPIKSCPEYYQGGTIPWIRTQDVRFNEIYEVGSHITEEAVKKTSAKWIPKNCVIVAISGASAGRCAINKIKATTNQHCLNMEIDPNKASYRYVFHCISNQYEELLNKRQGARGDLNAALILSLEIPLPSLAVQERLVSVLDNFDAICSNLNIGLPAEINARQKQYEYYRNMLLTFAVTGPTILDRQTDRQNIIKFLQYVFGFAMLPLSEISVVFRGEYITKKDSCVGEIPVILGGQEPAYHIDRSNHDGEIVVIARSGASAGFVSYWNQPIFVTDGFGYENSEGMTTAKYLYYALKNMEPMLNAMKRGAGVPHVSGEALSQVILPVPSIKEQNRIVEILDRFDVLCNDATQGLPAEITARQKQYEYYRDTLLSFKKLN